MTPEVEAEVKCTGGAKETHHLAFFDALIFSHSEHIRKYACFVGGMVALVIAAVVMVVVVVTVAAFVQNLKKIDGGKMDGGKSRHR